MGKVLCEGNQPMTRRKQNPDGVGRRVLQYAAWVRRLRIGKPIARLGTGVNDPLAELGQELDLLANTISQRELEIRKLLDIVEHVEKGLTVEDVLGRVFDGFSGLIPFDRIGCAFLVSNGARVEAYWARSELGPVQIGSGYSQPLSGSSLEKILASGEPRILNDLETYLRAKPQSDSTRRIVKEGGRSSLTCPLMVDEGPIGFLFFTSRRKDTYREIHQAIFRQIASQVSVVIAKSRIFEQVVDRNRKLLRKSKGLKIAATYDALTNILNRAAIMRIAEEAMKDARTSHTAVGAIMIDIDHFKEVNDTLGHAAGDEALKAVTRRLSSALRPIDHLGRYGGEEFLVIVADASREIVFDVAERLRREVSASPVDLGTGVRAITASFGVALSTASGDMPPKLISLADHALYAAKESGRNKVVAAWDAVEA